jgi:hypothetical protein
MKSSIAIAFAYVLLSGLPAFSQQYQEYHYSYPNARVVDQSRLWANPATTQITPGTMSPSARGINMQGEQNNPLLPAVHMGSTVTTAGDAQYQRHFAPPAQGQIIRINGGQVIAQPVAVAPAQVVMPAQNAGLPPANLGSHVRLPGDAIRSDLHPEYYAGNDTFWHPQLSVPSTAAPVAPRYTPSGGHGAATYNDDGQQGTHKINY